MTDEEKNNRWYRIKVGGLWKEIGDLQFNFLVKKGLLPEHYFLDIGCGSLRGGVHFIRYLENKHYFGIDKNLELLVGGSVELRENNLESNQPTLKQINDFDFESLEQKFDFALAQSVFTHIPLNDIIRCVMNIEKILVSGGKFYATFFENTSGKFNLKSINHSVGGRTTYFDKNPFHYSFETFEWICNDIDLKVNYIGDWNHPRDQKMIVFTKL